MSCELYKSEMYAWRPGSDAASFGPLFEHLATCPKCAEQFARLSASDQAIRETFQKFPDSPSLESRILAGLAHQRAQERGSEPGKEKRSASLWKSWFLLPIAASLIFGVMFGLAPRVQEERLGKQIASLLQQPPTAEINSTDQKQLLDWSAAALSGHAALPSELSKVEFRAATSLKVSNHKAVLLRMKNEQRASLLIVDALLTTSKTIKSFHEREGSDSRWSDGKRTYVLLFKGDEQEMHAYMSQMGIAA